MTRRLYNEDGYMQSFQAHVISCEAHSETTCQVVLDRTAFFPEGGGQSSDTGFLGGVPVIDVQEWKEQDIIHIVEKSQEVAEIFTVGNKVTGNINWSQRFDKMQQHTAEHIVSGIMHSLYGFHNVGFHLNHEVVTMDFDGVITRAQANELEVLIQEAVYANVPVEIQYPTQEELENLTYRSKIEIEGQVRLVNVTGYDICACCAPHVKMTGEIGMVKLTDIQSHRGGVRITMKCGKRGLLDHQEKSTSVKVLSGLLSAKESEVVQGVERLREELQNSRIDNRNLQNKLVCSKVKEIENQEVKDWIVLFEDDLDMEYVRELVNNLVELESYTREDGELYSASKPQVVAVFKPNVNGYQYIIASQVMDIRLIGKELNARCNGRGGGKPAMIQGSVQSSKEEIVMLLQEVEEKN